MTKQKVLVAGSGFGGVKAALDLADDDRFEVTLISDRADFRYYPTLYHAATGGLRSGSTIPLNHILGGKKINLIQAKAQRLDRRAKTLTTEDGQAFAYDVLALALGVITNYFGIKGLEEYSYGIKSQEEASRLKAHLHQQLTSEHKPDLNYVIIGAGPTGVELAGALSGYLRQIMKNHGMKKRAFHIDLIEAAPRVLPMGSKRTSNMVERQLKRLGVKLYLGKMVQGETADELLVSGKPIRSHTVIWTAGVTNNPFFAANNFALMGRGKVGVDTYLQADRDVYVIGDNANTPFSGMAQTAIHDAEFVAHNLKRIADGKSPKSYIAVKPISVIPAGENWAAVDWGRFNLYGKLGWAMRSAADFAAFHDYEPFFEAGKQWLKEFDSEEECPVCVTANSQA